MTKPITLYRTKLIALYSPAPGCGKSTIARYLGHEHNCATLRFASPLEMMLESLLMTVGRYTPSEIRFFLYDHVGKTVPIERLPGKPTGRHLKRTLGEEWGRQCNGPRFWALIWKERAERILAKGMWIVCDDLRLPEELDAVLGLGGEAWRIERPGHEATPDEDDHASDGALEDYHQIWHQRIRNDGTKQELLQYVDQCLKMEVVA
jgi:hypothetical protein